MSNIIIATAPHTGTHSVIELFRNKEYNKVDLDELVDGTIKLDETKTNLIYGHMRPRNMEIIEYLSQYSKIIIPIRDPLLSLISAKARQRPYFTGEIKDGKQNLATNTKMFIKPLNGRKDKKKKIKGLVHLEGRTIIGDCGNRYDLKESEHIPTSNIGIRQQLLLWEIWAKQMVGLNSLHVPLDLGVSDVVYNGIKFKDIGVYRTQGNYPLKQAYYNKDLLAISQELMDSLEALMKMEPILRPPLEKLGYKDLMWWSS